ncbi:hypothetical protein ACQ1ZK_18160, partial [Enterococcus faecium]
MALVLLVLGNAALFTFLGTRSAPADTYESRTETAGAEYPLAQDPVPAVPTTDAPADDPPVLAVYGDGYAAGNEM